MKDVKLTYFKRNGKYYTEYFYTTALVSDYEIYKQVRSMGQGEFPGLSEKSFWSGYILVQPQNGVSELVDMRGF